MLFYQPKEGYCYNSDSLLLYDFASAFIEKGGVLDIGAGCGVVGLLLAKRRPDIKLTMLEKQAVFAELACINARVNHVEAPVVHGDIREFAQQGFDYAIANPPFYDGAGAQGRDERRNICRFDTHMPAKTLFAQARKLLKPKGELLFCYEAARLPLLLSLLQEAGFGIEVLQFVHPKAKSRASIVLIRAKLGSRAKTSILPPFFIHKGEEFSAPMHKIYREAETYTLKCGI